MSTPSEQNNKEVVAQTLVIAAPVAGAGGLTGMLIATTLGIAVTGPIFIGAAMAIGCLGILKMRQDSQK